MSEIAEGFRRIMEMIGENPEEYWDKSAMGQPSMKDTLNTPEKIAQYNAAIKKSLGESESKGITGFEAARAAMAAAGDVILGVDRPEAPDRLSSVERLVNSAGPLMRRVEREVQSRSDGSSTSTFGGILRRL